jgi:hypothetical protein
MSVKAREECLAELVSHLSEAFSHFSTEALKLGTLLERSGQPVSRECYDKLGKQCLAEVQAFEEYLNRKEEIFAYIKVESRKP